MMDWLERSAREQAEAVRQKKTSAEELTRAALDRVAHYDGRVQALLHVNEAGSRKQAREVDQQVQAGKDPGPLAGVPVVLKDNLCTLGIPTTCASKILQGWEPPYNATVVDRLSAAGAVVIGKSNLDEFAMGSSCENSGFHPTFNPWDLTRVPGGSSGGSAASVAAGYAPLALGSDTGGSIRQPAALCGVAGLKPTYGRVSRYGLIAFASSLDQIGPFARSVDDLGLMLSVIAGQDPKDSTSAKVPVPDFAGQKDENIRGLTIGLPKEYYAAGLHPEVKDAIKAAQEELAKAGAQLKEISLPHTEFCLATYYLVATAEASSNLARYDGVQYGLRVHGDSLLDMYQATREAGFGPEVKRRIMLGTYALSAGYHDAYYKKALQVRTLIQQDFTKAFGQCDCILTPTAPTPAFKLGEKVDDPLTMYLSDIYTISANLAGLPGLSLPAGFSREGLPIGLQLLGQPFDEARLLKVGRVFQTRTDWHQRRPSLAA